MKLKKIMGLIIIVVLISVGLYLVMGREDPQQEQVVDLYFADNQAQYLRKETRVVGPEDIYLETLQALIEGPQEDRYRATIPGETRVESFTLANNRAEVSFNQAFREEHWGGSTGERITVYSIVNTLTQFSEIDEVKILVSGEELETLAGHMDLTVVFGYNEEIVRD